MSAGLIHTYKQSLLKYELYGICFWYIILWHIVQYIEIHGGDPQILSKCTFGRSLSESIYVEYDAI